jgi:hypothetical protein
MYPSAPLLLQIVVPFGVNWNWIRSDSLCDRTMEKDLGAP